MFTSLFGKAKKPRDMLVEWTEQVVRSFTRDEGADQTQVNEWVGEVIRAGKEPVTSIQVINNVRLIFPTMCVGIAHWKGKQPSGWPLVYHFADLISRNDPDTMTLNFLYEKRPNGRSDYEWIQFLRILDEDEEQWKQSKKPNAYNINGYFDGYVPGPALLWWWIYVHLVESILLHDDSPKRINGAKYALSGFGRQAAEHYSTTSRMGSRFISEIVTAQDNIRKILNVPPNINLV